MEQDLYGLQASGIDPEIAAQMLGLKRKRAVADALLQQSMNPLKADRVASGGIAVPISPWEGLAQMAKAYIGSKNMEDLDKQQGDLTKQNAAKVADAQMGYLQRRDGTAAQPIPDAGPGDVVDTSTMLNGRAPDKKGAVEAALFNNLIKDSPLVKMDASILEKSQQPYTLTAGAQRFGPDNKPLAAAGFKPDRPKPPMTDFQIAQLKDMVMKGADMGMDVTGLQQELAAAEAGRAALKAAGLPMPQTSPQPAAQPAQAGIPQAVIDAGAAGKPFVASQAPGQPVQFGAVPGLAPRDARAVAVDQAKKNIDLAGNNTERENKRAFGMSGLGDTIKEAGRLLDAKPTASGAGNIVDQVAGFFGGSPDGAAEAQALKAVGGALTSKMPRMEGPQSDKDTQLYKEMAGVVGDPTVPIARRKMALSVVKGLWSKYEPGSVEKSGNEAGGQITKQIASDAEYNALPSGAVFVGPDGKQRRKP